MKFIAIYEIKFFDKTNKKYVMAMPLEVKNEQEALEKVWNHPSDYYKKHIKSLSDLFDGKRMEHIPLLNCGDFTCEYPEDEPMGGSSAMFKTLIPYSDDIELATWKLVDTDKESSLRRSLLSTPTEDSFKNFIKDEQKNSSFLLKSVGLNHYLNNDICIDFETMRTTSSKLEITHVDFKKVGSLTENMTRGLIVIFENFTKRVSAKTMDLDKSISFQDQSVRLTLQK